MSKKILYTTILVLLLAGCRRGGTLFDEPTGRDTGIRFANTLQETEDLNILDYLYFYNGGGVAVGDINGDGLPEVFFSGNQAGNKLYLNKGNMQFEDITEKAGVPGNSSWNTGAVMADVNADGLLDIYVCAVVGINGFTGHNELYINNGDNTFTERAAEFGLDFDTYSSNAAFFDYDLDGDLDCYLLNHAVHTQDSYGKASLRYERSYETGDKLLRNDGGSFVDVSEAAGIYGGINGYGLGLSVSDFNQDGYPDLYIGNDFHEDDYYYLNNGDGTFREALREHFGHTSRFSMGSDAADINNDGRPDLMSLDMLPEEEVPLKSSEGDDNIQTQKMRIGQYGYYYQFTRNMLYVNQPDGRFMETALMSGVAATDWSWSALFADFDMDGHQDLFVSNGIPKRPNDLDFVRFISSEQISNKLDNTRLVDQKALNMMPSGNVHNYIFQGREGLHFEDRSDSWIRKDSILSGATALGDLDGDGDLDVVINNLNREASVLENQSGDERHYLKVKLEYRGGNPYGIGTKVYVYSRGRTLFRELFPVRGFQAASEPILHFGLGRDTIDSLRVIWPDRTYQSLQAPEADQTLVIKPQGTKPFDYHTLHPNSPPLFQKAGGPLPVIRHEEDPYTDFNREKLLPYSLADRGPALAVGDLDGDGSQDLFVGGSKRVPPALYLQQNDTLVPARLPGISEDSIQENIDALITDLDGDGQGELLLANGGSDYFGASEYLQNRIYQRQDARFLSAVLDPGFANSSVLRPSDYDGDGDTDLFVGNQSVTGSFGTLPDSYLLENQNGTLVVSGALDGQGLGMVTDAVWTDFNEDGRPDLLIVGEWMQPQFYENTAAGFRRLETDAPSGLWQSAASFDIDADGDPDYLLGNWGTNSKFHSSEAYPMRLYLHDFDGDGSTDPVLATEKNGEYYPLSGLDDLASQMVSLRRKYPRYSDFAGRTVQEVFGEADLETASVMEAGELRSGFLRNEGGRFTFVPFPAEMQAAPILEFLAFDFDGDGQEELLAGGNYFGVKPYQGRLDGFPGALIQSENEILLGNRIGLDFFKRSVRGLEIIRLGETPYLLAVFNDAQADFYALTPKTNN